MFPLKLQVSLTLICEGDNEAKPTEVVKLAIELIGNAGLISYEKGSNDSYPSDFV